MGSYDRLPLPLAQRLASVTKPLFAPQGREFDCAIGGIPFRLATYSELPQSVETVSVRRDQLDTETDPGEQSLTSWWRRSQSSFHEGAGNVYQEKSDQAVDSAAYYDSEGVDVFTPGRVKLLKKMKLWGPAFGGTRIRTFSINSLRTNHCTNPAFELNTTGWTGTDSPSSTFPPTLARDLTRSHSGTYSLRATYTGDDGLGGPPGVDFTATGLPTSTAVTISAWVYVPPGGVTIQAVAPGTAFGTNTGGVTGQWRRINATGVSDGSGNATFSFWPMTPPTAGMQIWIDDVLIETGSFVGSYFDGSSPNSAWAGSANASKSTETIVSTSVSVSMVAAGILFSAASVGAGTTLVHAPVGKTVVDGLISGGFFFDAASDGTLYQGTLASPGTATTWPLGATPSRMAWGKHRLWVIGGNKLWQPNLALAGGTSQPAIFTHPNPGWTYTCMAEGGSAMLFGGHDGFASTIQSVTLDSGGGLPTLTGAAVTAVLPDGELVQELSVLAGQYVGIGTTRGFRVGTMSNTGQLTYGPLIIEPDGVSACTSLTTQGRYFLVAFRTTAGTALAYRVDTGNPLDNNLFPYAKDASCEFTGAIISMAAASSSRIVCITSDGSTWYQSATEYVDTGWLQTGRVRFRTTEPKNFKALAVEIEPLAGSIACSLVPEGSTALALGSITVAGEVFDDSFTFDLTPMKYLSVRFTLASGNSGLDSPTLLSYQLKALPAVPPQRLITLPLLCYDKEKAPSGHYYGGMGYAADRLLALQLIENAADTVLYQDFTGPDSSGQLVTIESLKFVQTVPASTSTTSQKTGPGGILIAQLRTI